MDKILLYGSRGCSHCGEVHKFLEENGIEFEFYDVMQDREKGKELFEKTGQEEIPVFEINGEFVIGFKKDEIKAKLGL